MKQRNKKTWTVADVEKYAQELMNNSEVLISNLKEEIKVLKIKNSKLQKDIHDLRAKEKKMSKTLTETTVKVKDSAMENVMKASLTSAKIKSFGARWSEHFRTLNRELKDESLKNAKREFDSEIKTLIDEIEQVAGFVFSGNDINQKMSNTIDISDFKSNVFVASGDKITKEDEKRYNNILKEVKNQMIHTSKLSEKSESGFDIDEALNPTDSLDDIVKDILK